MASQLGVSQRIDFLGHVDEETLLHHYARCRAVLFAPYREDYGFVTLEAFRSRKPVLTCADSGGPTELVVHDHSGFVVAPDPGAIARHLEVWHRNREVAVRMGESGNADTWGITWEAALSKLLLA